VSVGEELPSPIKQGAILGTSAQEVEQALVEDFPKEFPTLDRVEFMEEDRGYLGMIKDFLLYDESGEMIGSVAVWSSTGEISSIIYHPLPDEQITPSPISSMEEAKEIARAFIAEWGFDLNEEFVLVEEYVNDKEYQLEWRRRFGEVLLPESFYLFINGATGTVNLAMFPKSDGPLPQSPEELKYRISREEALEIAKAQFSSREGMIPIDDEWEAVLSEDVKLYYLPTEGGPRIFWRAEIMYEYYPLGVEQIEENAMEHMGGMVDIDAKSGEVILFNPCL
jgi:hypothetical protein